MLSLMASPLVRGVMAAPHAFLTTNPHVSHARVTRRGIHRAHALLTAGGKKRGGRAPSNKYADTLNLPATTFPMRANAKEREPVLQERCVEALYKWQLHSRAGTAKDFVLHDGPPYANGMLHIGHALNKILKDFVNRYRVLRGNRVTYVPGWDCHGLPIELKALESFKGTKGLSTQDIRSAARRHAERHVEIHRQEFRRWGVLADWENTYTTMDKEYESSQIGLFLNMLEKGCIYRGIRPVYWSPSSRTALAEAELEYPEGHKSQSILVSFPVSAQAGDEKGVLGACKGVEAVIWTTTPWTIPANLAISVHPDVEYCLGSANGRRFVVASERVAYLSEAIGAPLHVEETFKGSELAGYHYTHPLNDKSLPIVCGGHVTATSGTGLVHTAPGHGHDDFEICRQHGIESFCPVDGNGVFTAEAGSHFEGMHVLGDGNAAAIAALTEAGSLLASEEYEHKYPYDWRTKKPVIIRTTQQWFADVGGLVTEAAAAVDGVAMIPASGAARLKGMLRGRTNWCISRQRVWGVPIPVLYDEDTDEALLTVDNVRHIQSLFAEHGTDCWWTLPVADLLATAYKNNGRRYRRGMDTMDVWFDSGSSWRGVLEARGLAVPADVYLEGSDQHRGWFQSSLLTSVAASGQAPYKAVITHGFVLDESGRKMSKSLGNIMEPSVIVNGGKNAKTHPPYGADTLRLWVASTDYTRDVHIGANTLAKMNDGLRKLRNTSRFLLGNTTDYRDDIHRPSFADLHQVDQLMLHRLHELSHQVTDAYDAYNFHRVFQLVCDFNTTDLSAFYCDVSKDRLYSEPANSVSRRAAQWVLVECASFLKTSLSPILPHLAEDVHEYRNSDLRAQVNGPVPAPEDTAPGNTAAAPDSVFLLGWLDPPTAWGNPALAREWELLRDVRGQVNRAIEVARGNKDLGGNLEAEVTLTTGDRAICDTLCALGPQLEDLLIVSRATVIHDPSCTQSVTSGGTEVPLSVRVTRSVHGKCQRCWKHVLDRGADTDLCGRCAQAIPN